MFISQRKRLLSFLFLFIPGFVYAAPQSQRMPWPEVTPHARVVTGSTAEAKQILKDTATSSAHTLFDQIFNATDRPAWLTRTDITYDVQHATTPVSGLETIQPLYTDVRHTLFWQGRASYNDGSSTYNLGLGYRFLGERKDFMWGINTFFDENPRYQHKRLGLGAEYFTPYVTFRANYYDALTGRRYTSSNIFERALNGYDASVESPVPYFAWMRFTVEGYHWRGVVANDVNGGLAKLRIFPARQLEVDAGVSEDNSQNFQAFMSLNYYFGAPDFIENSGTTPATSEGVFAAQNLENMRLEKVIRNNNIVVEKTVGTAGSTAIIIARGT